MTNEEIQKVMEFIIKQQESFSEKLEQMRELHNLRISSVEAAVVHLYNASTDLYKAQEKLAAKMIELAEAQTHTEQRLNALIDIVQQGRGGTPEV
jgi:septal ring factor EnvC (AmiA/AmiB activator)